MPTHWTYESFQLTDDLQQGDILQPTEELRTVLNDVHPHFLNPKYTAFLVTTQSCDLVIRNKLYPDTKYLNIAVIRPIEAVIHNFLPLVCRPVIEGVYIHETKQYAYMLLERLFNQNEQALGLFYLHPDTAAGIPTASVSLLRVTVTLKADHYKVLQRARVGRLHKEFCNKLGWLVGNLYSRIGTQDWSEQDDRRKELRKMLKETIDISDKDDLIAPRWIPESWVNAAKEKGIDISQLTKENIISELEKIKPPTSKATAISHVDRVVNEVYPSIDKELLKKILNRLNNDQLFSQVFRSIKSEYEN